MPIASLEAGENEQALGGRIQTTELIVPISFRPGGSCVSETGFDLVILGGGSGGYACALRASQLGLSVALIEKDKLGVSET